MFSTIEERIDSSLECGLRIDPRATVHPSAKLADDVVVGPWSVIGPHVEIDSGCWIGPHVVIKGPSKIGKNNKIFQFSSIGDAPQDVTYNDEPTRLEIGDNNTIREYCMINRGTVKGGGLTKIGDHNFLMAFSHIGHDCRLGNNIQLVNYCALSGHVVVNDFAIIGAYSAIHQFAVVGAYSFVGRASYVTKDVLPYIIVMGNTPEACGLNLVGLKRRGFNSTQIEQLRRAYKIIFRQGLTVKEAIVELEAMLPDCDAISLLLDGLKASTRGVVR